jgi:phosphoribosylanthranilate isomerase
MSYTRIKICGITRVEDALSAAQAGADAIGLVFAEGSPRRLHTEQARRIAAALPPFVSTVALFVNPSQELVAQVIAQVRPDCLQFHGEETPDFCAAFNLPWLKVARVRADIDLLQFAARYAGAQGLLLDAYSAAAHGGTGERFDWGLIPADLSRPVVLAGGLTPDNVAEAVRHVRPWAVDVSSGVEAAPGIKDAAKIAAFVKEVKDADVDVGE